MDAAKNLLQAGLELLSALTPSNGSPDTTAGTSADRAWNVRHALADLVKSDPQTRRPVLSIPLPESFSVERLAGVIGGFLGKILQA
jgi:hypothetical protein